MEPNTIFTENSVLVYKGIVKAFYKRFGIKGFNNSWPLTSLDLNPIKKV